MTKPEDQPSPLDEHTPHCKRWTVYWMNNAGGWGDTGTCSCGRDNA